MERESFEDEQVANILNKNFVSIKVDREERPDIDSIYMSVCQALTNQGGWPLTIIMDSEMRPFFAGTYFPKHDRMEFAGLITILNRTINAWKNNRTLLIKSGKDIIKLLNKPYNTFNEEIDKNIIDETFSHLKYSFDITYGGFGNAPKFPTPHTLLFLLRYWYVTGEDFALEMVEKTLTHMYEGGMFDHIGFGFSRYSTDRKWLIPHFEKMLYDNALLAIAYLEAYQVTKNLKFSNIAQQIFTYILRDMTSTEGGFYSAEDADSEGIEGKFYVWTPEEVQHVLSKNNGEIICKYFNITPQGNFEGKNILNLINSFISEEKETFVNECRDKLFNHREKRVHPHKDDKILTSWNGLMIAALAIGGRILKNDKYTHAAEKALKFIFSNLINKNGDLMARYRDGEAAYSAYLDDYAFLIWGLIELYETTYKPEYLKKALKLNENMLKEFWDEDGGALFLYGNNSETLIMRPKEIYDGAIPSGNSVAALNFLRLAKLTGKYELENKANVIFKIFSDKVLSAPSGHTFLLSAYLFSISSTKEVIIVDNKDKYTNKMTQIIDNTFNPFLVSISYSDKNDTLSDIIPFLKNYKEIDNKTTAYICENFSCKSPITNITELNKLLSN